MSRGGAARNRHLQLMAYRWVLRQGYDSVGLDVPVSQIGGRFGVAGYQWEAPRKRRGSTSMKAGAVMVCECHAERAGFLREARSEDALLEQLKDLNHQRSHWEESLRREFPTLREGVTLFPEYDAYRFQEVAGEGYGQLLLQIEELSRLLYVRGKFARMLRWHAANLYYVVAESGVVHSDELPAHWGLVEREGDGLEVRVKAVWQEAPEFHRWVMASRIAAASTRSLEVALVEEAKGYMEMQRELL